MPGELARSETLFPQRRRESGFGHDEGSAFAERRQLDHLVHVLDVAGSDELGAVLDDRPWLREKELRLAAVDELRFDEVAGDVREPQVPRKDGTWTR